MVTHDRGLAAFADRVVHMLDGKIKHIEEVSEQSRLEAMRDLLERLATAENASSSAQHDEVVTESRVPDANWMVPIQ